MNALRGMGLGLFVLVLIDQAPAEDVAPPLSPAQQREAVLKGTVPPLIKALKDPDEQVRAHAAAALCNLDKLAVPALIKVLDSEDNVLRVQAAKVLGNMSMHGRRHVEALPALTRALSDSDVEVRRAASFAINWTSVAALEKQ